MRHAACRMLVTRVLVTLGTAIPLAMAVIVAASTQALAAGLPAAGVSGDRQAWPAQLSQPSRSGSPSVAVTRMPGAPGTPAIAPLHGLLQADLLVVDAAPLSTSVTAALRRLPGVTAAQQVDAARIQVDGKLTAMLGVDPSAFRAFAAQPTADSVGLWQNVAEGGIAVSYTMGTMDKLPPGHPVQVDGRHTEELPLAGLGTVGIAGIDAVVSDTVARSLGIPAGNAIVVSAPHARLSTLLQQVTRLLPRGGQAAPLVAQPAASGSGGAGASSAGAGVSGSGGNGPELTSAQVVAFLRAAESRLGLPYVWGGDGPNVFDCSGLVQWSMAQAGIAMPRVAADQALVGPLVPVSQLQPGDLLFYHTDPTAPGYISHVAIYLGDGVMLQAPEPGLDVEAVPAAFGSEYAGAVAVYPRVAAAVAGESAA